ncbi:glycolate oxidase iron-sulfur subunit, partial [Pseudomonas syringae pv. actinidiae ICMP 18807]
SMQTTLSEHARTQPRAEEAERILRSCVHCGFCNATCPTYQLLLDRCLSCRNCETTCPSGVDYHNLLDIGRAAVDAVVPRPLGQRLLREGLR